MNIKHLVVVTLAGLSIAATADVMDRPQGIKIGERMTLKPYVGLSYTYDSNIYSKKTKTGKFGKKDSSIWHVDPNLDLIYLGDSWSLMGSVWYKYNAYSRDSSHNNKSSYGERLKFDWTDSKSDEAGWRVLLSEKFEQITQDDDMNSGGRGVGRDRKEFNGDGTIERRLNQYWHLAALGNYYMIDYDNTANNSSSYYGWKRAVIGGEGGYAPTKWTDFILHANYQWYWQDNAGSKVGNRIRDNSRGYTVMGGLATHATEKITYRLLGGWSRFEYGGNGGHDVNGFTYQGSVNWQISQTLHFMALATSYYQPSEYEVGTANRVDALSFGVGKSLVRGKVNATGDIAYRHESREYSLNDNYDYEEDIWTFRVGVNYVINRFITTFSNIEYQTCDVGGKKKNAPESYDRFRFTVGLRLTY